MGKLFISYAHEDKAVTEALAKALEHDGHKIWWDSELAAGDAFRPQIQAALDAADLVLVIWSARSRHSRFVADEADIAYTDGKLLPLSIEGVRPPLGFGAIHTVDLKSWAGAEDDADLKVLRDKISQRLRGVVPPPRRLSLHRIGAAGMLCVITSLALGVAQAVVLVGRKALSGSAPVPLEVVRFGAEHAAIALALALPVAAFAAMHCRRFGLARFRAIARPYTRTLAIGFVIALAIAALAMANGVHAMLPPQERALELLSIVLLSTMAVAALVAGARLLSAMLRG